MHRAPLLSIVGVFALSGLATAQAARKAHHGTTICHRTLSAKHPYVRLTVSNAALAGHQHHPGDIIPAPAGGCPTTPMDPHHGGHVLTAPLTGAAEVPGPGDHDGTGTATIRVRPGEGLLCYQLVVSNIALPATAAHIHQGDAGVAGPVVVPLSAPDATGKADGCVAVARTLADAILANPAGFYANVQTMDFPAGAVRGQL